MSSNYVKYGIVEIEPPAKELCYSEMLLFMEISFRFKTVSKWLNLPNKNLPYGVGDQRRTKLNWAYAQSDQVYVVSLQKL